MAELTPPFFMRKRQDFNKDECFLEAKKYSSRVSFFKDSQWAYSHLQRRGLLGDACSHMPMSPVYAPPKWTHKSAFSEASKFGSRSEFKRNCSGAHGYLIANNALDQACAHMRGSGFWHMFELMAIAIKYSNFHEFKKWEHQAYNFANQYKLTKVACAHMTRTCRIWTKESVIEEAKKFQSISDFFAAFPGAYKHANKYGYWSDACAHMDVKKRPMDKEMSMTEALKYTTRADFQILDGGAYVYARLNGFLDEACSHMIDGDGGFNQRKPGVLYCIEFTKPCGEKLYKVGITNRCAKIRLRGIGLHPGIKATVLHEIKYPCGADARAKEKAVHASMAGFRYQGNPIMDNGNTEVFSRDATNYL